MPLMPFNSSPSSMRFSRRSIPKKAATASALRQGVIFFVARIDGLPTGCGGVQLVGKEYAEIKRMYVRPQFRGSGLGKNILTHLADYTRQRDINVLRLETGIHQVEAINLYQRFGFERIAPFGPYRIDPLSLCFEKRLT